MQVISVITSYSIHYTKLYENWFLHSDGGVSYHSSDPENMSESILTVEDFGIVPFEAFDIFEDLY